MAGHTDDQCGKTREQVAAQCRAVAGLAETLARLHRDYAKLFEAADCPMDNLIEMIGSRTAGFMENIGDMLNGMDAASKDDEWMAPIFEAAQRLWPQVRAES